jgi:hypothetical protein
MSDETANTNGNSLPSLLLTREQAAQCLAVSLRTFDEHGASIPYVPFGTRKLYLPETLKKWAADHETTNPNGDT